MTNISGDLKIVMLGGFTPYFNNRPLNMEHAGGKVMEVWQQMLYGGIKGAGRDDLLMQLYGKADAESANSLRALVFRLRNFLDERGLDGAGSIKVRSSVYYWTGCAYTLDAHQFEAAAEKALKATSKRKPELLLSACRLYGGRLLPENSNTFITREADRLEELYTQCLYSLIPLLREQERYEELYQVAVGASRNLPEEEQWTLLMIDCLLSMERFEDGLKIYQTAVDRLAAEKGVAPSDAMMQRYKEMSARLRFSLSNLSTVQADLWEQADNTSYQCSYPGFVDCYRVASRAIARYGGTGCLVLCTITDRSDVPICKGNRLSCAAAALQESIGHALRGSDVYTCCSPCQYLILLMGLPAAESGPVVQRIQNAFSEHSESWGCRLRMEVSPATPPAPAAAE